MPGPLINDDFEENPPALEERPTSGNQGNGQGEINSPPVAENHSESEENSNSDNSGNEQGESNPPPSPNPERSSTSDNSDEQDESNPPNSTLPLRKIIGFTFILLLASSLITGGWYFFNQNPEHSPIPIIEEQTNKIKELIDTVVSLKEEIISLDEKTKEGNIQNTEAIIKMITELQINFDKRWETVLTTIKDGNEPVTVPLELELHKLTQENRELKRTIDFMIQQVRNVEMQRMLNELSNKIDENIIIIRETTPEPKPKPEINNVSVCSHQVPLSLIDVKSQQIPIDYKHWVKGAGDTFVAEKPFFIMNKEVTVAEFECFFKDLPKERQEKIGRNWIQDNKDAPVTSISWETAHEYANWLSQQTGDSWSLPTYNQWLATVTHSKPNIKQEIVRENAPKKAIDMPMPIIRTGELNNIVDLLGNVREWSLDTCEGNGHYVLGADYMIMRDKHLNDIRKPFCHTSDSITIGFRLVRSRNENLKLQKKETTST